MTLEFRLSTVLESYRARWNQKKRSQLARQLRRFADALLDQKGGRRAKEGGGFSLGPLTTFW
jgi:hypothetical protein